MIGDVVQEGQTVQFQVRDAQAADEIYGTAGRPHPGSRLPHLARCYSVVVDAGKGLFGIPNHDAAGVLGEQLARFSGFRIFAQGEVGPVGGRIFPWLYSQHCDIF